MSSRLWADDLPSQTAGLVIQGRQHLSSLKLQVLMTKERIASSKDQINASRQMLECLTRQEAFLNGEGFNGSPVIDIPPPKT